MLGKLKAPLLAVVLNVDVSERDITVTLDDLDND